jgi:hypothetical protein
MDKVHKSSDSECYTSSSEPYRFYIHLLVYARLRIQHYVILYYIMLYNLEVSSLLLLFVSKIFVIINLVCTYPILLTKGHLHFENTGCVEPQFILGK